MQRAHLVLTRLAYQGLEIKAQADFDVLLRQVVAVDQHLANLVGAIRILPLVGVVNSPGTFVSVDFAENDGGPRLRIKDRRIGTLIPCRKRDGGWRGRGVAVD